MWGRLGVTVSGSTFSTDGYAPVVAVNPAGVAERGAVDNNITDEYHNLNVKLDYAASDRVRAFFRTGYFRDVRNNGKASTIDGTEEANNTRQKSASGGVNIQLPDRSTVQATVFGDMENFHSNFLAVPAATPARSIGRMSLNQYVPTTSAGGMVQWSRPFARMHVVTAGTDWRWVDGDSNEDGLDATTGTQVILKRVSGGTQRSTGAFVQDVFSPTTKLSFTASARIDHWRSYNAHNLETNIPSGTPTAGNIPNLPEREDTVASPRIAALYHVSDRVSVWGDIGAGFRAPTLNELYRQFRQGTTLTTANNQLAPERLKGGEAGVTLQPMKNLGVRSTWFDNRIKDPVANVTISQVGANVTQQRQNLGRTRVWGIQTDADYRIGAFLKVSAGYVYDVAKVVEAPAVPALVNNCNGQAGQACYLQQVPKNRGSISVTYSNPRFFTAGVEVDGIGSQFDDDQNSRIVPGYTTPGLPKYAVVSLTASRSITRNLEAFVGVQNLTNQEYFVGTLPTLLGTPRMVNGGIRVRVAGK